MTHTHGNKGNRNAAKTDDDKLLSRYHVRVATEDKAKWIKAAQREGVKLSQWVVKNLNASAKISGNPSGAFKFECVEYNIYSPSDKPRQDAYGFGRYYLVDWHLEADYKITAPDGTSEICSIIFVRNIDMIQRGQIVPVYIDVGSRAHISLCEICGSDEVELPRLISGIEYDATRIMTDEVEKVLKVMDHSIII